MTTSAPTQALGVLKLVELHLDHPTVISKSMLRDACAEAKQRLEANQPHAEELGRLAAELVRITPRGYVPYVAYLQGCAAPYAAIITNAEGNVVNRQVGKSISSLVQIISLRFPPKPEARQ